MYLCWYPASTDPDLRVKRVEEEERCEGVGQEEREREKETHFTGERIETTTKQKAYDAREREEVK